MAPNSTLEEETDSGEIAMATGINGGEGATRSECRVSSHFVYCISNITLMNDDMIPFSGQHMVLAEMTTLFPDCYSQIHNLFEKLDPRTHSGFYCT